MGAVVGTWFASALFSLIIAIGLNLLDRTMAWYGRPLWVFFLYMVPTMLVSQLVIYLHAKYNHKVSYVFFLKKILVLILDFKNNHRFRYFKCLFIFYIFIFRISKDSLNMSHPSGKRISRCLMIHLRKKRIQTEDKELDVVSYFQQYLNTWWC